MCCTVSSKLTSCLRRRDAGTATRQPAKNPTRRNKCESGSICSLGPIEEEVQVRGVHHPLVRRRGELYRVRRVPSIEIRRLAILGRLVGEVPVPARELGFASERLGEVVERSELGLVVHRETALERRVGLRESATATATALNSCLEPGAGVRSGKMNSIPRTTLTRLKYRDEVMPVYSVVALTTEVLDPAKVVPSSVVWPAMTGTLASSVGCLEDGASGERPLTSQTCPG